jgi:hypothetical protein
LKTRGRKKIRFAADVGTHGQNAEIPQGALWSAVVEPQPVSAASTR